VLYAGRGRDFEPVYLNPLAPLYAEQWNARWDDNLFFDADVLLRLPGRAEIRAEVLIDDLQIDPGSEPNEVGLFLGVDAVNPLAPDRSLLGCSYARLANRTYGHAAAWNRFLHEGRVMGYLGGPDGDRLSAWCSWAPVASLDLTATYSLTRQGEGRADDPQDQPGHETSFPSGTVETTHMVAAGLGWRPVYPLRVAALAEWSAGRNVGNLEGEDTDGFRGSLSITYDVRVWGEMD